MQIRMQNAEILTRKQLDEFLKGSEPIEFNVQDRDDLYGWVQRILIGQEYAVQDKKQRGTIRAYLSKITGRSLPQVTRWIRQYRKEGVVQPAVYQRRRFPSKYTSQDVALLAAVDSAHGWVSGPATLRILKREHEQYGNSEFARLSEMSTAHLYNLRHSTRYRNWPQPGSPRGPAGSRSESAANRIRRVGQVFCASTRCIKATGTE